MAFNCLYPVMRMEKFLAIRLCQKIFLCDLAKVKISENDDGTYTAKIPVTEHRFDCNRHIRADVTTYTITFTPDGEVLNLTSKKVKG